MDAAGRIGPTLPTIWVAGPVLAFAVRGGWRWGAVAATVVGIANILEQGAVTRPTLHNVLLVCVASIGIGYVIEVARETGTKLSICGELASDPFGVPLLLALGIENLSVNPSLLLETKELIRRLTVTEVEPILEQALRAESAKQVRELIGKLIYARYPDILRFLV